MIEDVGEADTDSKDQGVTGGLVMAMKDMKVWLMMFVLCAYVVGLSFNAFFVSAIHSPTRASRRFSNSCRSQHSPVLLDSTTSQRS